jgi:HlyD family secretion protein
MKKLFRQAALDRLSSPEQLDQLLQVTTPRTWLALATLCGVLLLSVLWGFIGRVPEHVTGSGILLRGGGVLELSPLVGGRLSDLAIQQGDMVEVGQVIARIYQPEQAEKLRQATAALETQRQELVRTTQYNRANNDLQEASLTQQIANLQQTIETSQQDLRSMEEKVATQTQLATQGLLTKQTLVTTRQGADGIRQKIREYEQQITHNRADLIKLRTDAGKSLEMAQAKYADAEREQRVVEREARDAGEVVSPYTGRILEVLATQGSYVQGGAPIATLDLRGRSVKRLEAVVYVKSTDGKRLKPGMKIHLSPSTVRREEFGFLEGTVTFVSDFPATPRGMTRTLKNDKLVVSLAGNDAPYQVFADLTPDPTTPSQYRWTSSQGPPVTIESGTLCTGDILVSEQRPIDMVVPLLRRQAGL